MSLLSNALNIPIMSKSDLYYKDYSWRVLGDDNPHITGYPDNIFLNRGEGYEVLKFLNAFLKHSLYLKSPTDGRKAEIMIRNNVPKALHSRKNIDEWLRTNWNNF